MPLSRFKLFKGKEGFYQVRDDWQKVAGWLSTKHFFNLYECAKSYMEAARDDVAQSLRIFVLYRDDIPVGIFPLVPAQRKIFGITFKVLTIPHPEGEPTFDFICDRKEENKGLMKVFIESLKTNYKNGWDCVMLSAREDSFVYYCLQNNGGMPVSLRKKSRIYYFKADNYERIWQGVSRNFKHNIRQARNRLFQEGKVEFVSIRDKENLPRAFREFIAIEGSGWKSEKGTAIRNNQAARNVYENLIMNFSDKNGSEINLLRVNGKSIAGALCILAGGTANILKVGYDEKHSYFRPGILLFDELLKRYSNNPEVCTVNTGACSAWVEKWKPQSMASYDIAIFNRSLRGLLCFFLYRLRRAKRRLSGRLCGRRSCGLINAGSPDIPEKVRPGTQSANSRKEERAGCSRA